MERLKKLAEVFKKKLEYAASFVVLVAFIGLSVTESGIKTEYGMYDTLLMLKPAPTERKDILLVNIDDAAIEEIGAWPWSRDIIADAILRLREVGARYSVFDIEYLSPGQPGVNRSYVKNDFPAEYGAVHSEILEYLDGFTQAVASRSVTISDVSEFGGEMTAHVDNRMKDLSSSITGNIFRDNDAYFARALKLFGRAYLTINSEKINVSDEAKPAEDYALEQLLLSNVEDPNKLIDAENEKTRHDSQYDKGISPAILELLSAARGAGFPNVYIDEDGVRRRIPLLVHHEGKYVAQLVFSPILDILKPERMIRSGHSLVLKNALSPVDPGSPERADIYIPLDENGRLLINWLKKNFSDPSDPAKASFRSISVLALKRCDEIEEKLIDNLTAIEGLGIKTAAGYLAYHDGAIYLHSLWRELEGWKAALMMGERDDYEDYRSAKKDFFAAYNEYLTGGYDTEIYDTLERFASMTQDDRYRGIRDDIEKNFEVYREDLKVHQNQIETLERICADTFCIIGYSGVGTSDLGVNPFWKLYPNVGTHANIYNTIMSGQYIYALPAWVSWVVALVLCYICAMAHRRIKSLRGRIIFGIASTTVVFVISAVIFTLFRIYLQTLLPVIAVFMSFILISILRFVFSEQEKSFLRKAFTMYLSSDVVNQIVDDPSLLKLGGQEKQITALFTDIKSFSTLSEKVSPEHLVQILNKYLTVMSDIVLDQKGTIDKYIGDAIVSFFGAPIDLPDHAIRACMAAVRMKEAEVRLNEEMLASGDTPMPIYTRIGINTGAMVVGNMGTDNKMNYTIMGNDVNLAARLEGVNKQYGTWILVSESTWNATGGLFLGRKLDRVRVVGIDTPVQLYNIMAVRAEAKGNMVALADRFNFAMDAYRAKKFSDALLLFTKCAELEPEDAATQIYLDRVKDLLKNGVPDNWTDVINMTSK